MVSLTQISNGSSLPTASGPLVSLTNPTMGPPVGILKYPLDLGSSTKNHYVKFVIKQIDTSEFITQSNAGTVIEKTLQSIFDHSFKSPTVSLSSFIALYMPDTLNASYSADYSRLSLTTDLGAANEAIQYMQTARGSGTKGSVLSRDAALLDATSKTITAVSKGTISDNFSTLVSQSKGVAVNPQIQMIFNGVDFRSFQLTFIFTPNSKEEAQAVDTIINTFKYHYAPDILNPTTAGNGLFYVPPSYFNIEFMFGNEENTYLPRYGDCVLNSIDVNYAPNGFASHIDGSPVQTQLNLSFTEMEIVTKTKLKNGISGNSNASASAGSRSGGLR